MLQRGRGLGALDVVTQPDAVDLAIGCVVNDSRWDTQTEERDLYLARLVIELTAPLDGIRGHVLDPATWQTNSGRDSGLACGVLLTLGRAGYSGSGSIVREYLTSATGQQWEYMIDAAWECGDDTLRRDLDALVLGRLTEQDLDTLVSSTYGPWQTWSERHPRVAQAFHRRDEQRREQRTGRQVPRRPPRPRRGELQKLTATQLADLTSDQDPHTRWEAWRELGRRRDLSLLDLAEATTARTSFGTIPGLTHALDQLGALALDRARTWAYGSDEFLATSAMQVLAGHGTTQDEATLLTRLEQACAQGWWYHVETCAHGLGRLTTTAAVPLLTDAWHSTEHSHGRAALLEALRAIDPVTAAPFATEALHDCESSVRALGAATCVSTPGNLQRLRHLRDDPIEHDGVRLAAGERVPAHGS